MTECVFCSMARHAKSGEKTVRLPAMVAELGLRGVWAHASCVVAERQKQAARAERFGGHIQLSNHKRAPVGRPKGERK